MTYKPGGGGESGRIITADRERHIRTDEREKVLDEICAADCDSKSEECKTCIVTKLRKQGEQE